MSNPWELKVDDSRKEDSLITFIIFCEDEVSEELYFKYFETEKIKVNVIKNQKSMMDNVINAITYCKENNLMVQGLNGLVLENKDLQVWCVYDRDIENDTTKNARGNTEFDEAIETASSKGIQVAWSNDDFELWILLHFEDVNPADLRYQKRVHYYDLLTNMFKSIADPSEDLQKVLRHATFGYKKDMKHRNNFKDIIHPMIIPNTMLAIERAKQLEIKHAAVEYNHQKVPCTQIYKLVEALLDKGRKKIQ